MDNNKIKNPSSIVSPKQSGICNSKKDFIALDDFKIKNYLQDNKFDTSILDITILSQIDSTNSFLLEKNNFTNKITACLAESQTKGRGRLGRSWHSPAGENIYLSLAYVFDAKPDALSALSLVAGLALCDALGSIFLKAAKPMLKWPNDILVAGSKLAGILIEMQKHGDGYAAVIGLGLNVNMQHATEASIDKQWTSIFECTSKLQDRNFISAIIIKKITEYIEVFKLQGFAAFEKLWREKDALRNKKIKLTSGNKVYRGVALGVSLKGHIIIKNDSADVLEFSSGEATLA